MVIDFFRIIILEEFSYAFLDWLFILVSVFVRKVSFPLCILLIYTPLPSTKVSHYGRMYVDSPF